VSAVCHEEDICLAIGNLRNSRLSAGLQRSSVDAVHRILGRSKSGDAMKDVVKVTC